MSHWRRSLAAWIVPAGVFQSVVVGGAYGTGRRMKLEYTRAIIDAIHSGELAAAPTTRDPWFGFEVPTRCSGVPDSILTPRNVWSDQAEYDRTAANLAERFRKNFAKYADAAGPELLAGGPCAAG